MKISNIIVTASIACCSMGIASAEAATLFGGIDFPQGESSFADAVIQYDPDFGLGPAPTTFTDPLLALGPPGDANDSVALGRGGLLELAFTDNVLTNSGSGDLDLHIFEVGPAVEPTDVAIRPTAATLALLDPAGDANGDGFFEIGGVSGATDSIDIDSFFPGFASGELLFDAVQLIDTGNITVAGATGADINAVGAISSAPPPPVSLDL